MIDGSNPQESATYYFPGDDLFTPVTRRRGLPIGNLTSQHFANFYLHPLDHFVRDELHIRAPIRYVDDILLFADGKEQLHKARQAIEQYLQRLRLVIHHHRAQPTPSTRPLPFLGYIVTGTTIRVRGENLRRARRRRPVRLAEVRRGVRTPAEFKSSVFGWLGYAGLGGLTGAIAGAAGVAVART